MKIDSPFRISIVRLIVFLVIMIAGYWLCTLIDRPVYHWVRSIENTGKFDWNRMLRIMGYAPFWLVVAAVIGLHDRVHIRTQGFVQAMHRVILLVVSVGLNGLLAEGLKVIARRERPSYTDGLYEFRDFADAFSSPSLGMPSSHTIVAFAAAWMMCKLFPKASIIWIGLAIGCGITRVLSGRHFVSDAFVPAVLAYAVAGALWHWHISHQDAASKATSE